MLALRGIRHSAGKQVSCMACICGTHRDTVPNTSFSFWAAVWLCLTTDQVNVRADWVLWASAMLALACTPHKAAEFGALLGSSC